VEIRRPYDIDSLTDVALCVFAERGYDGASMDDVARAAGITKATIYHHVPGKEALLERGLQRALGALFAVLDEPLARDGRALDRVRHIVSRVAAITCDLLPEVSVLFRARGNSDVERAAIERRRTFDRIVAGLLAAAERDGDLRAGIDPGLATRLIFGMSNSLVEWFRPEGRIDRDAVAHAIVALVFEGIAR